MKLMNQLVGLLCALSLVSCGIMDTAKETKNSVQESNRKQEQLIELMKKMEDLTKKLGQKMDTTNDAIHNQTLAVALQSMVDPKNSEFLEPPIRMMPFAKVFADEAEAWEILETVHVLFNDVQKGFNNTLPPTELNWRIRDRQVAWGMVLAISGAMSNEKFEEIQKDEVEEEGRFRKTAKVIAVARFNMLNIAYITPVTDDEEAVTLDGLEHAVKYFTSLKKVMDLPFIQKRGAKPYTISLQKLNSKQVGDPAKAVPEFEFSNRIVSIDPAEFTRLKEKCKTTYDELKDEPEAKKLLATFN